VSLYLLVAIMILIYPNQLFAKHIICYRNYNEPTDGRYCDENDTFCYENRVVMQVIKQIYPLADINGNPDITLNAGDWHDDPGNLLFPGLYKCCYAYQCNAIVGNDDLSEKS